MTAEPGESTPDSDEPKGTASPGRNPLRLTLATMMVAVLASAAAAAMTVRTYRIFEGGFGVDIAALLLIAVVLTAIAIGCLRRSSLVAILLQITVCCTFITGMVEMRETVPRVFRYTLQLGFALMVALPLALRRFATPDGPSKPRRPRLLTLSEFLLGCGVHLLLVWIGILLQVLFIQFS